MGAGRSQSEKLFQQFQQVFPGGVNSPVRAFRSVGGNPFIVDRGEGACLFDVDGNRYVDYVLSWGPLVLGHSHPKVVAALSEQLSKGTSYGACAHPELRLARQVQSLMPSIEMIRFVNSGTEAAMSVLRLARAFTGKEKIIKFHGCYHGHADSLLVKAGSGVLTLGLPDSPGVIKGAAATTLLAHYNDIERVRACFEGHKGEVAAIIVEPVMGNAGFVLPQNEFLSKLRTLADEYGCLLIFDEVMTGFRVGLGGAQEVFGVRPDLTMLGKVIGGGLPVGAYGGRKDIMEHVAPLGAVYQAGTLSGNPLAMVAGAVTLEVWQQEFKQVCASATELVEHLRTVASQRSIPLYADCLGSMFGFFFAERPVKTSMDLQYVDKDRFTRFFQAMLDEGIYFAPSPFEAGFVSSVHVGEALEATKDAISHVFKQL